MFEEYGNFMEVPLSYMSNGRKFKKALGYMGKYIGKEINRLKINVNDIYDFELITKEPFYNYYDNELDKIITLKEPKFYIGWRFKCNKGKGSK
jgi:hypothetical protein